MYNLDFRLRALTFDNQPWVITMKKNEHYFPTMEYVKDTSEPLGWKKVIHECDETGAREETAPEGMETGGGHEDLDEAAAPN